MMKLVCSKVSENFVIFIYLFSASDESLIEEAGAASVESTGAGTDQTDVQLLEQPAGRMEVIMDMVEEEEDDGEDNGEQRLHRSPGQTLVGRISVWMRVRNLFRMLL